MLSAMSTSFLAPAGATGFGSDTNDSKTGHASMPSIASAGSPGDGSDAPPSFAKVANHCNSDALGLDGQHDESRKYNYLTSVVCKGPVYLGSQNRSVRPLAALVSVCVNSNGSDR